MGMRLKFCHDLLRYAFAPATMGDVDTLYFAVVAVIRHDFDRANTHHCFFLKCCHEIRSRAGQFPGRIEVIGFRWVKGKLVLIQLLYKRNNAGLCGVNPPDNNHGSRTPGQSLVVRHTTRASPSPWDSRSLIWRHVW